VATFLTNLAKLGLGLANGRERNANWTLAPEVVVVVAEVAVAEVAVAEVAVAEVAVAEVAVAEVAVAEVAVAEAAVAEAVVVEAVVEAEACALAKPTVNQEFSLLRITRVLEEAQRSSGSGHIMHE
jgi:hypothetical protein